LPGEKENNITYSHTRVLYQFPSPSGTPVLISLVLCTRNRHSALRVCLEHVERLESPGEWELVVVDNGSTDGTADLLKSFAERTSFRVVVVSEPKPGLGGARNAGVAKAAGQVIAFTDDDCYVRSDFLIKILEIFKDRRIGFMGGRILLYDESDLAITIQPDTEARLIGPYGFVQAGELHGANMAVRRSLMAEIGGFDPKFGKGSQFKGGEDTDLQSRASQSGATGIYHPGPLVWHHHGRKSREDYNSLMKEYDYSRGAYYMKFILNSQTRTLFLKNWYGRTKRHLRHRHFLVLLHEVAGAAHYILVHLFELTRNAGLFSQGGIGNNLKRR
jgi:glycosyltransferase involved in cell wall biosynthesis